MGLEERTQRREIDGFNYEVIPLTTSPGLKALQRTIKLLAPLLGAAIKEGGDVGDLLSTVPSVLGEDDLEYFAQAFGKTSRFQVGTAWMPLDEAQRELHFAGRYPALFKWIVFSMEVNFSGFFPSMEGQADGPGILDQLKKMLSRSKAGAG